MNLRKLCEALLSADPDIVEIVQELISTLHTQYAYDGNYPKENADEAYARWRQIVARFIDELEGVRKC
jgi:hypothetical protein